MFSGQGEQLVGLRKKESEREKYTHSSSFSWPTKNGGGTKST
jgi:hypothetical protein